MKQLNWYQIFGNVHTIPEGSTVTPTDDVQILLHCANIWDKSYTTIGEVIADDDTLFLTLIDNNAIDYLVRSTTFASSIVADEESMEYIGASDYASETLLNDSTWLTAIVGSAYKDYILNESIPTMTSNTSPSGYVADASSTLTTNYPYKAFDNVYPTSAGQSSNRSGWTSTSNASTNQWLSIKFPYAVCAKEMDFVFDFLNSDTQKYTIKNYKIERSSDGVTWERIGSDRLMPNQLNVVVSLPESINFNDYYRVFAYDGYGATVLQILELKMKCRSIGGVQSWLAAGGITNKKYTTVSEVLSDLTTLATLMSSTDAIDYLVTAKGWATEICSDSNAMADIGMNNYAANTLLADETWAEAIGNSDYVESVMNVKVPAMTDNTHPYGTCIRRSIGGSAYEAWKAFDGGSFDIYDSSSLYSSAENVANEYLGYIFLTACKIRFCKIAITSNSTNARTDTIKIQASNDSFTTPIDMSDSISVGVQRPNITKLVVMLDTTNAYSGFRLIRTSSLGRLEVQEVQFYGRKDI